MKKFLIVLIGILLVSILSHSAVAQTPYYGPFMYESPDSTITATGAATNIWTVADATSRDTGEAFDVSYFDEMYLWSKATSKDNDSAVATVYLYQSNAYPDSSTASAFGLYYGFALTDSLSITDTLPHYQKWANFKKSKYALILLSGITDSDSIFRVKMDGYAKAAGK